MKQTTLSQTAVYLPSRSVVSVILISLVLLLFVPGSSRAYFQEQVDSLSLKSHLELRDQLKYDLEYQILLARLRSNSDDRDALNKLGLKLIEYDHLDSAETVFKSLLEYDDSQAAGHNGLGLVYLNRGSSRFILYEELKVLVRQDNYAKAIREFETALEIDPGFYEAQFHISEAYFAKEGEDNTRIAEEVLTELIELDPDYPDIHYLLGRVYYESEEYARAELHLMQQLDITPDHSPAKIYLGLTYYRTDRDEEATEMYIQGLDELEDTEIIEEIYTDFRWIPTDEEKDAISDMPLRERGRYIADYWRRNDANLITKANERFIEHLLRVDRAKDFYDENNYRGYDDRGEFYIKYGEPDDKYLSDEERHGIRFNVESWFYTSIDRNLAFKFTEKSGAGYRFEPLELPQGFYVDPMLIDIAIANAPQQNFEIKFEEIPLDFPWSYAQFRGPGGSTAFEVYLGVPYDELEFEERGNEFAADIETSVVVLDSSGIRHDEVNRSRSITTQEVDDDKFALSLESFELTAGEYLFGVQAKQESANRLGIYQTAIPVRDFSADSLTVSDIRIDTETGDPSFAAITSREDLNMKPYPFPFVNKLLPLSMYFEIYNLSEDSNGNTAYTLEYTVLRDRTVQGNPVSFIRKIGRRLLFMSDGSISFTQERTGRDRDAVEFINIDAGNLPNAKMVITVTVTDKNSGQSAVSTRKIEFIK
ncbi:tetratricopeptide repeat protein [candidate division KSB1 bacterium]